MQDVDVILCKEVCRYTCFVRPCNVMLDNAKSGILPETINDHL